MRADTSPRSMLNLLVARGRSSSCGERFRVRVVTLGMLAHGTYSLHLSCAHHREDAPARVQLVGSATCGIEVAELGECKVDGLDAIEEGILSVPVAGEGHQLARRPVHGACEAAHHVGLRGEARAGRLLR
jgi:hypothetical protein